MVKLRMSSWSLNDISCVFTSTQPSTGNEHRAGYTVKPITVGLDVLRGQWTTSWNLVSAGSVVAALPPVIMFFILQRQFIQGLTFGAVKG